MTYLFSENRELKNIHDGDVVVNDWVDDGEFFNVCIQYASTINNQCMFSIQNYNGINFYSAHFTRTQSYTEPQPAPDIPVPCRSN